MVVVLAYTDTDLCSVGFSHILSQEEQVNGKVFLTLLISTVSSRLQLKHSNVHVSSISFLIWSSLNSIVKWWESKSACVIMVFGCLLNIESWSHLLYTHTLNDNVLYTYTCLYCLITVVNTVC